jgi:hypothetical protein
VDSGFTDGARSALTPSKTGVEQAFPLFYVIFIT